MAVGRTNAGGGGGTGGTLVVTAPVGVTVTAINETLDKTYTRVANWEGKATFKGLTSGTWLLSIDDDSHEPSTPVQIVIDADYEITLSFFSATINVSYPPGSICTAKHEDGDILTAPDASGTWTVTVPKSGKWTIESDDGDMSADELVQITSNGESKSVDLAYFDYIIKNGKLRPEYSFAQNSLNYIEADGYAQFKTKDGSGGNGSAVVNKNGKAIDMSQYTKMRIDLEATSKRSGTDDYFIVGVANLADASTGIQNSVQKSLGVSNPVARNTFDLNIANNDDGYFAIRISDIATYVDLRIHNVWFE